MRPIDADKIRDRVNERYKCCNPGSIVEACLGAMLDIIDTEPTVTLPPNAPLTLDELREMGSDMYSLMYSPVWIECKESQMYNWTGYDLIAVHNDLIISALNRLLSIRDYGDSWLAYRRKPEEGTT